MYILAEIPGRYWMGSPFLSVVGIIYLLLCIGLVIGFGRRGNAWAGVGWNVFLFLFGILLVYCAEGIDPARNQWDQRGQIPGFSLVCLDREGRHPVRKETLMLYPKGGYMSSRRTYGGRIESFQVIFYGDWPTHKSSDSNKSSGPKGTWYEIRDDNLFYSMHVNGLSPYIFHPSCLYWSPGVVAVPFFLLGIFAFGGVRG